MRTLTISSTGNNELALSVAEYLALVNVSADIIPGLSVVSGNVEQRVEIRLFEAGPDLVRAIWTALKARLDLTCAWFDGPEGTGCIYGTLIVDRKRFPTRDELEQFPSIPARSVPREPRKATVAAYPSPRKAERAPSTGETDGQDGGFQAVAMYDVMPWD